VCVAVFLRLTWVQQESNPLNIGCVQLQVTGLWFHLIL